MNFWVQCSIVRHCPDYVVEDYQENHPASVVTLHMYVHGYIHPQTVTMHVHTTLMYNLKEKSIGKVVTRKAKRNFQCRHHKVNLTFDLVTKHLPRVSSLSTHNPDIHRHCHLLYLLDPTEMSLAIIWQVITVRNTQRPTPVISRFPMTASKQCTFC